MSTSALEEMEETVGVRNIGHIGRTPTQQERLQRLEVSRTSPAMKTSYHAPEQESLVTVHVSQSSVSSSSNPFSIDRILQRTPPPTARLWSTDVEDHQSSDETWSAPTQPLSFSHQHPSSWSRSWPSNYISTTTQQFGYPSANIHVNGKIIPYDHWRRSWGGRGGTRPPPQKFGVGGH